MDSLISQLSSVRDDGDFASTLRRIEDLVAALNTTVADEARRINEALAREQGELARLDSHAAFLSTSLTVAGVSAAMRSQSLAKTPAGMDRPMKKVYALQSDEMPVKCRAPAQRPSLDFFQVAKPSPTLPQVVPRRIDRSGSFRTPPRERTPVKEQPIQGTKRSATDRDEDLVASARGGMDSKRPPRPHSMRAAAAAVLVTESVPSIPQRARPPVDQRSESEQPVRKSSSYDDLSLGGVKPRPLPRPPGMSVGGADASSAKEGDHDVNDDGDVQPMRRPMARSMDAGHGASLDEAPSQSVARKLPPPRPARDVGVAKPAAAAAAEEPATAPPRVKAAPPPRPGRDVVSTGPPPRDSSMDATNEESSKRSVPIRTKPPPPARSVVVVEEQSAEANDDEDGAAEAPTPSKAASTRPLPPPRAAVAARAQSVSMEEKVPQPVRARPPPRPSRADAQAPPPPTDEDQALPVAHDPSPPPPPRMRSMPPPRPGREKQATAPIQEAEAPTPAVRAKPPPRPVKASTEPKNLEAEQDEDYATPPSSPPPADVARVKPPPRPVPTSKSVESATAAAAAAEQAPAPRAKPPPRANPPPPSKSVTLNIGSGVAPGQSFSRPPKSELGKYLAMQKAGLPQGAIENAMMRDGIHPAALFDSPLNNPTVATAPVVVVAAKPAPASSKPASSKPGGKPPGMSMMEEMKWKQQQKKGEL